MSHAANLRKEIAQLLDAWLEENSSAMLARWLIELRGHLVRAEDGVSEGDPRTKAAHSVSDNFLADQQMPPPRRAAWREVAPAVWVCEPAATPVLTPFLLASRGPGSVS